MNLPVITGDQGEEEGRAGDSNRQELIIFEMITQNKRNGIE